MRSDAAAAASGSSSVRLTRNRRGPRRSAAGEPWLPSNSRPRTKTQSVTRGSGLGFLGVGGLLLLQLLLDHLALERADEVDQQLAGQVIVLVQHAAGEQRLALDLEHRAVEAGRAELAAHRALDLD